MRITNYLYLFFVPLPVFLCVFALPFALLSWKQKSWMPISGAVIGFVIGFALTYLVVDFPVIYFRIADFIPPISVGDSGVSLVYIASEEWVPVLGGIMGMYVLGIWFNRRSRTTKASAAASAKD